MTAPVPPTGPGTGDGSRPGPQYDDPTGLRYDRADFDDTPNTPIREVGGWSVTGRGITVDDPLCGHLPGEQHDGTCDYWRGVALGEYPPADGMPGPYELPGPVARPPFDLRALREAHVTAADLDRGAA